MSEFNTVPCLCQCTLELENGTRCSGLELRVLSLESRFLILKSPLPAEFLPFRITAMNLLTCKKFIIPLLLGLLLCAAFYDVIFLNKTFKVTTANSQALPTGVYGQENNKPPFIPVNGTDAPVLEEPIYQFIKDNLGKGILPLWNPHQACGYPLIGMIQTAIFYPLNLILYLLPSLYSWDILILIRLFLCGLFTFWMMKTFRFKHIPSVSAALIFMLSGPMVLLQYWTANVDILLPLLLLCYERLIRAPGLRRSAMLGLVIGLTILGGHPEHIFLVNIYGFIFFIARLVMLKKMRVRLGTRDSGFAGRGPRTALFFHFLFACVLGAGLSAVALFPFIQNFLTEFWHGHPSGAGLLMEEQRGRIITLALPHFFQKAPVTFDWTFAGWWGGYIGIFPLALAFLGLFQNQKKGLNVFFGIMAFVIIAKEYGMPVINWIGYLPFFHLVRYAIHTPPLAAFSIAVLAGMGVRAVQIQKSLWKHGLLFSGILILLTLINLFIVRPADHFALSLKAGLYAGLLLGIFLLILFLKNRGLLSRKAVGIVLIAAVFLELFSYIHRQRPRRFDSFAKVPYIEMLKTATTPVRSYGNFWAFYPNCATGFSVDDLGFFMGLAPKRFVSFVNEFLSPGLFQNNFRSPALRSIPIIGRDRFLDLLNVRYLILPSDDILLKPFPHFGDYTKNLEKVYHREVRVYKRPDTFARAFMVYHAVAETDQAKTFQLLNALKNQLDQTAVINAEKIEDFLKTLNASSSWRSRIDFLSYTPNRIELETNTIRPGLLVLSEAYHPDWRAYIDGKAVPVYPANILMRSIFLPEGKHHVTFAFRPFWFYAGITVTLISLLMLLLSATPFLKRTENK